MEAEGPGPQLFLQISRGWKEQEEAAGRAPAHPPRHAMQCDGLGALTPRTDHAEADGPQEDGFWAGNPGQTSQNLLSRPVSLSAQLGPSLNHRPK